MPMPSRRWTPHTTGWGAAGSVSGRAMESSGDDGDEGCTPCVPLVPLNCALRSGREGNARVRVFYHNRRCLMCV